MAEVAVAVVSWNTRELLARCLRCLEGEARSGRADVWVVDNGSTDGSDDLVETSFGWARLIRTGENLGFGRAVNLVAAATATPWVAAANADVAPRPGSLATLLRAGGQDPRAGALAPRLVLPDGSTQHSAYPFPTVPLALADALGARRVPGLGRALCLPGAGQAEVARPVPWAVGAFLLLRREAWEAAGGFDPGQWLYAEDLDLGWRLRRAGWRTRYVPEAEVLHDESAATAAAWHDEWQRRARWQAATYRWLERRRGRRTARAIAAVNAVSAGTRALALIPACRIRPGRYGWRRRLLQRWARLHRDAGLRLSG